MNNPIDIGAMYGINNRSNQMPSHNNMNMSTSEIIDEMNMPVSMQSWQNEKSCSNNMTPYDTDMPMHSSDIQYQDREHNMYSTQNHNTMNSHKSSNRTNNMTNQRYMHTNNNAQLMPMNNMGMQGMNTPQIITIKNSHLNDKNSVEYMNDLLRTQVGKLAEVEFLIGTNSTHLKQGQITGVGTNYIVIKEFDTGRTTIGNFENIKFVTIYDTNYSW